jgi:mono/diheme cytochrome c family protein
LRHFARFLLAASSIVFLPLATAQNSATPDPGPSAATIAKYCATCHNDKLKTGGLTLQNADLADVAHNAETWEKVIRKLRTGSMPPQTAPHPDAAAVNSLASFLETSLDRAAVAKPNPGHASMHRLNRAEYANAIHDLLALDVDSSALLPADDESSGFDNIADVLRMSPSLMERYLSASWNISREAVGDMAIASATTTYRVKPDLSQDQHIEGLPLGTRGGAAFRHYFPLDAEYIVKVRLWRNTFDLMRGMEDPHQIEISIDGKRVALVTAGGHDDFVRMASNPGEYGAELDRRLTARIPIKAGPHTIAAAVLLRSHAEKDDMIKPFLRTTVDGLDITGDPSVDRMSVEGPLAASGPGTTPSRAKVFSCRPTAQADEVPCARKIVSTLMRRAYRRPIDDRDLETPLSFYQRARNSKGTFDAGIEAALQFILASPEFLFRFEADPKDLAPGSVYKVSDVALASRLAFFLWSTPPDDELLTVAASGKLRDRTVLEAQVKRMLADPRATALVDNFASQWLFLRNLKSFTPDLQTFPDFDDNLRESMGEETRLFFSSIIREDRSAMDLLNADYTFVNERLARHYGIPNIYGNQFRRIHIDTPERRGLLGQASILAVTSYPNRTSPVQRGKWVLTNLLGIPPTPPPPDVPKLKDNEEGAPPLSLRERMEKHRADPVCAGCHKVMDPIGFALENFDAVGHYRTMDDGNAIDASGTLYNGAKIAGAQDLAKMLSANQDVFIGVLTEKLLTYALGRGLEYYDMPTVRQIVHEADARNDRFSSIVLGIVESTPFEMRTKAAQSQQLEGKGN